MTGQDIIDFIEAVEMEDCHIEVVIYGNHYRITGAATYEDLIRLTIDDDD